MNICRVCLLDSKFGFVLIGEIIEDQTTAKMIHFCSGIEVSQNDNMPQVVCSDCLEMLITACKIKQMCIDSDKILRHQIKDEPAYDSSKIQPEEYNLNVLEENCDKFIDELVINTPKARSNKLVKKSRSCDKELELKPKQEAQSIIKCYLCNIKFKYRKEKSVHLEECHSKDELKCKICKHRSQTPRGLDNHLMLHENPDLLLHMCHICGKKTYQKACELRRHIKVAHGDKSKRQSNFHCDRCGFKTFSKMNMKRHLNTIHLKIKAFVCQLCPDKKYTSKITLDQHMISKHGQETDFVCQCCHRKFPTMSFLRSHLKSTCSGLPGSVRDRRDPNEYREPLYDELDHYKCKLCGLIFEGKGKIAQHYAQRHKHSNSCDLCPATFNSYSNLKKHIQILHNKIHKYICSYCSRSFGQKNQLQSHINTHTGDKPFQCKFECCNFRSGDLSAVSKHKKKCANNPANKI